ncbi:MAG: hypothetical protein RBR71_14100 [Gudongella sp.]|nr:hypothetical protein [Gudongella sp.]
MVTAKQMTMFAFEDTPVSSDPIWLEDYDGKHNTVYRMDAEAIVEDLNRMPSGKGSWLRCLEVDHSRSYEEQFKDWDACIWLQRGIGLKKMVKCNGDVMDCIDPHPYKWHYMNGKQIRPWKYEPLKEAWIDDRTLHIKLESGEYLADVLPNSMIDRYDLHPYRPSYDLEHFAIECYRHKLPREMMKWRAHYMYGTPCLRPFSRNISHDDAKKIDLMGNIPGSMVRNEEFDQICECAERIGIQLELSYDVPPLMNLAMYPVEESCKTCLRKKSENKDKESSCWKVSGQTCCSSYMWDRRTPAKKNIVKTRVIEDDDECAYCTQYD